MSVNKHRFVSGIFVEKRIFQQKKTYESSIGSFFSEQQKSQKMRGWNLDNAIGKKDTLGGGDGDLEEPPVGLSPEEHHTWRASVMDQQNKQPKYK